MVKPSIFSKDYDRKMKTRKRRIIIAAVLIVLAVIVVGAFSVVSLKGAFKDLSKSNNTAQSAKSTPAKNTPAKNTEAKPKNKTSENSYSVQLSDGKTAKAVYEVSNGSKVFKSVTLDGGNAIYDISPSKKDVIIYDEKAQSMVLLDTDGNKQDVTNPQYTSTNGNVITKNDQLASDPNYVWCSGPKFLDDNNIAYISQLPWIGKTTKYVWIESLSNKNHVLIQGIEGENIKLDKITDKGLTVISDDKTVYLKADGSFVE